MKRFIIAALATLAMAAAVAGSASASADKLEGPNGETQVVVCKYVGTPGVDERLQTGQNPIVVNYHALLGDGFTGTFPFDFSDAQGNSIAIRWAADSHDGSITECPGYEQPPVVTTVAPIAPTFTPATCDSPGAVTVPEQPEGVVVSETQDGNIVTVTFSAAEGYTLGDAQTVYTFDLTDGTATGGCGGGGGGGSTPPPVVTPVTHGGGQSGELPHTL